VLQLARHATLITSTPAELAAATEQFAACSYVKLPGFVEPELLRMLMLLLDRTPFHGRIHDGIGSEVCAESGAATGALELMMNDPALAAFVSELTGCGPIGCYEGRIYRLSPAAGHYDSWHSDVGEDRLLALSINLSREPFEGGRLQIRRADEEQLVAEVDNPVAGDAVLFRVHPSMRHRVAPVSGRNPRTAWAGWFRAAPRFGDLLAARLSR